MAPKPLIRLVQVRCRAEFLRPGLGTMAEVDYARECGGPNAIYITLRLARGHNIQFPNRNDQDMKISGLRLPFSRNVAFEFCGDRIDQLLQAVSLADADQAQMVLALAPLLNYVQQHFSAIRR